MPGIPSSSLPSFQSDRARKDPSFLPFNPLPLCMQRTKGSQKGEKGVRRDQYIFSNKDGEGDAVGKSRSHNNINIIFSHSRLHACSLTFLGNAE